MTRPVFGRDRLPEDERDCPAWPVIEDPEDPDEDEPADDDQDDE